MDTNNRRNRGSANDRMPRSTGNVRALRGYRPPRSSAAPLDGLQLSSAAIAGCSAASRVGTAADDYDPIVIEAQADRINRAAARALLSNAEPPDTRRLVVEACAAAARLRRLATDIRMLERLLVDTGLLAGAEDDRSEDAC